MPLSKAVSAALGALGSQVTPRSRLTTRSGIHTACLKLRRTTALGFGVTATTLAGFGPIFALILLRVRRGASQPDDQWARPVPHFGPSRVACQSWAGRASAFCGGWSISPSFVLGRSARGLPGNAEYAKFGASGAIGTTTAARLGGPWAVG